MIKDYYKKKLNYNLDILNYDFDRCRAYSLYKLIEYTKLNNINMIEIGSYSGVSCDIFLHTNKVSHITCVDPWWIGIKHAEDIFDSKFKNNPKVLKFKGKIDDLIKYPEYLKDIDLVYIDGLHTYNAVKNDIEKTLKYIKPKYISGHDYIEKSDIMKVVNDFFKEPDILYYDGSWIKKL